MTVVLRSTVPEGGGVCLPASTVLFLQFFVNASSSFVLPESSRAPLRSPILPGLYGAAVLPVAVY